MKSKLIGILLCFCIYCVTFAARAEIYLETLARITSIDGMAVGPDGNIYSSNYGTGVVYRTTPIGEVSIVVASNQTGPAGIIFDPQDNMLVAQYNANSILKVAPDGSSETLINGVREPIGLDWDSQENLYISHFAGDATVTKVAPDGTKSNFVKLNQLSSISSVCVDANDNVYVTSYRSGDIYKISQNGNVSLFASVSVGGYGFIRFDATNTKFYATVIDTNQLIEFDTEGNLSLVIDTPAGGVQDGPLDIATMNSALGLAITDDGQRVYFATSDSVRRVVFADPQTDQLRPYFIGTPLTSVEEGSEYSYQFNIADPNDDMLTISFENLPGWLNFDGIDRIFGIPSSSGNYEVSAQLSDGVDTVSQVFNVNVTPVTEPPTSGTSSGGGGSMGTFLYLLGLAVFGKYLFGRNQCF